MQLTKFARGLFSLAAVMPLVFTLIVNYAITHYQYDISSACIWIAIAIFALIVPIIILRGYLKLNLSKQHLRQQFVSISLIRSNPIVFVLVYLLPIVISQSPTLFQSIFFGTVLFACLFMVHTVALSPILSVLGYRIYKVTSSENCEFVLLSKRDIKRANAEISFLKIDNFTFIERE